jgi:hypothetical protein
LKTQSKLKKGLKQGVSFLFIAILICVMTGKTRAYVMPAEQLVDLMTRNLPKFKTLVITQSTHLITPEDLEVQMVLEEKIWLKSPGFHHSEMMDQTGDWDTGTNRVRVKRPSPDMAFRQIFMTGDKNTIMSLLSEMGINLNAVAFTRFDDVIAYRLGDEDAGKPKLLIEKEKFLPLLLNYRVWGDSGEKTVTVRFDDYREVVEGWYPYEIALFSGEDLEERYFVIDLKANIPVDPSFFERNEEHQPPPDEERLREVIDFLKKKYKPADSSTNGN